MEQASEARDGEGGSLGPADRPLTAPGMGTVSPAEWTEQIKPRVHAELDRLEHHRVDTQAMMAILEGKRYPSDQDCQGGAPALNALAVSVARNTGSDSFSAVPLEVDGRRLGADPAGISQSQV